MTRWAAIAMILPMRCAYTVELFSGDGRHRHRFRVRAANGEIVAQSEGYGRKRDRDAMSRKLASDLFAGCGGHVQVIDGDGKSIRAYMRGDE